MRWKYRKERLETLDTHYDFPKDFLVTFSLWRYHLSDNFQANGRMDLRKRPSKLLDNIFDRLYAVRHEDIKAILDDF